MIKHVGVFFKNIVLQFKSYTIYLEFVQGHT
jgi:hypothetical protein